MRKNEPTYRSWVSMKQRCGRRRDHKDHAKYAARGVKVCARWARSYESFLKDMGKRPPGTTLDRIDNNGDYEPGNCRWATPKQQLRNTRANRMLTHDGETLCLADWAERTGLSSVTIAARIDRHGWSVSKALMTPLNETRKGQARCQRIVTLHGRSQNLKEWASEYGIPYHTLHSRVNRLGWGLEKALITPVRAKRS